MISLHKVSRYYESGERSVHALENISLAIAQHEFRRRGRAEWLRQEHPDASHRRARPADRGEIVVDGLR
jgi:hypothetical protein